MAVAMEMAPFVVIVDHFQLSPHSHSSDLPFATPTTVMPPALSADGSVSAPPTPPPTSVSSHSPCPQPSPLTNVLAASLLEPSPFSLNAPSNEAQLATTNTATAQSAAVSLFSLRQLFSGYSSPFAAVPHRLPWARRLFRLLSHPLTLFCTSLLLLALQLLLLNASLYSLYVLYTASTPLSRLSTAIFSLFLCFLVVRSFAYSVMVSMRVLNVQLWINVPAASASRVARGYYPLLLLLRVLSLLFLLAATATLIFATPLTLSSPALLMVFVLLSYDAITLSLPLLIVPTLAFLIPLHSLHMSFPFIPITHHLPPLPRPGMSAAQLAQLDETVWRKSAGGEEADVCAVCLCELAEGARVRRLPKCAHVFHVPCIDSWLERRAKCPLCVQSVDIQQCAV